MLRVTARETTRQSKRETEKRQSETMKKGRQLGRHDRGRDNEKRENRDIQSYYLDLFSFASGNN